MPLERSFFEESMDDAKIISLKKNKLDNEEQQPLEEVILGEIEVYDQQEMRWSSLSTSL
jgi:hypothetical protein